MGSLLRQLSSSQIWKSSSRRWDKGAKWDDTLEGMKGMYGSYGSTGFVTKKRVMVVVDESSHSKQAMMWTLTHVAKNGDILTLLQIVPPSEDSSLSQLATALGSLCKACKPEVEVETLVIQGPRMATVISQVKKLEVKVLVLGQKKPSLFLKCLCLKSSADEFVEQCINTLDCLTIGVRKQSNGVGGYLVSTRWHSLCLKSSADEFVEQRINTLDCLTIGVRKQSNGVGGYLVSTRWHRNFWLLA